MQGFLAQVSGLHSWTKLPERSPVLWLKEDVGKIATKNKILDMFLHFNV
jgi:hypothetical protein